MVSEKPNIFFFFFGGGGGIWVYYCTVAKTMDQDRPICIEVNGCARVACAVRPCRSIPVAIFLNYDA